MALGMTMSLPERDRYHIQRKRMIAQLCILLAGRAAESLFCDDITSGAQSDLDQATDLARSMVCRWGMSERVGPVSYHEIEETFFVGRDQSVRPRICSEVMAIKIDEEITRLITDALESAKKLIAEHRDVLEHVAQALLKYEVLHAADVEAILAGKEVQTPQGIEEEGERPEPERPSR
jgi:cell division protease FtsH